MNLDVLKHTVLDIGIGGNVRPDLRGAFGIDDDQRTNAVGQRSGEDETPGLVDLVQVGEMGWAVFGAELDAVARVSADDDEEHADVSLVAGAATSTARRSNWTAAIGPDTVSHMSDEHQPQIPNALEQMVLGLTELEAVLGEAGRRAIPAVRDRLGDALAARDRGDPVAMLDAVGAAMQALAAVGEQLEPGEGQLMTMLAQRFQSSLMRGDIPDAKKDMDVMFERSGARIVDDKKK